jgi:hypothetical protein
MPMPPQEVRSITAWMPVLEHVQKTLDQCLERADGPPKAGADGPGPGVEIPLRRLDERLARLQGALDLAEKNAAAADALITAEVEAVERWRAARAEAQRRLAEWAARAV